MVTTNQMNVLADLSEQVGLPKRYLNQFESIVAPLLDQWTIEHQANKKPSIWGVQGSQGSGKSTLSQFIRCYLEEKYQLSVQVCSIDDFYLTKEERGKLAETVHPLFCTRGVPGTHDTKMMLEVFKALNDHRLYEVPSFNKAEDDRRDQKDWLSWQSSPEILIFEGWCVGITAQPKNQLNKGVNQLEVKEDELGIWREYVNDKLQNEYADIYRCLDKLLVIQAPSFDCVYQWRLQQEKELLKAQAGEASAIMNANEIERFIAHYQRLTEHGFASLPALANAVLYLNEDHGFGDLVINDCAQ